jgi:hypothetical protein
VVRRWRSSSSTSKEGCFFYLAKVLPLKEVVYGDRAQGSPDLFFLLSSFKISNPNISKILKKYLRMGNVVFFHCVNF